jgi:hypothetical protein
MALRAVPDSAGPSLRNLLRAEAQARGAISEAAELDAAAARAIHPAARRAATQRALAARRRALAQRTRFLDPDDLTACLDDWAETVNDPAVLDRLIEALTYTPSTGDAA